jgi:hypothetical protein
MKNTIIISVEEAKAIFDYPYKVLAHNTNMSAKE